MVEVVTSLPPYTPDVPGIARCRHDRRSDEPDWLGETKRARKPWLLVFDAASTHVGAEFRKAVTELCPWVAEAYVLPGETAVAQPLDLAVF